MTKTFEIVTCAKGGYVFTKYNNQTLTKNYYKTKTELNKKVKELKSAGYAERA